jgi:dihydroorotate dehydrogenase
MYKVLRYLLFALSAETSHYVALNALKFAHAIKLTHLLFPKPQNIPTKVFGLLFKNPVGISAGLDKNGDYIDALASLGVGFIEVGTITPRPQPGNPKPRLHRIVEANSLINWMGFNNKGVDYLVANLKQRKTDCIIGVNLGKNVDVPLADAHQDYITCLQKVYPYTDFASINISCPNTGNLTDLQNKTRLQNLLTHIQQARQHLAIEHNKQIPLLVKVAPDLTDTELYEIVEVIEKVGLDGIIGFNTAKQRYALKAHKKAAYHGGLSGAAIAEAADIMLEKIHQHSKIPIISVGGISSVEEAKKRFRHGASLIQLYTGLIYAGPQLPRKIINSL